MAKHWKSIRDLENDPALERFVEDEFPARSAQWLLPVNRREVLDQRKAAPPDRRG